MDLLLDPVTHDIIYQNGKTLVTQSKADVVAQRLKIKLNTFLGEWFLDLDVGIPYFQQILNKVRNKSTIDAIFQRAILEDPDVIEMISYTSDLNGRSRTFSLDFAVRVENNEIVPINFELLVGV
tara:strand:+ start:3371 stop:3742 length:372 start_codon:yes stop_codon:yes gene_type:complete